MRDLPVAFGAHAMDYDYLLRAFEWAVSAPVFDYAGRDGGADPGQSRELFDGGGVEIEALLSGPGVGREAGEQDCAADEQTGERAAEQARRLKTARPRGAFQSCPRSRYLH
jgi:hypothetical protein